MLHSAKKNLQRFDARRKFFRRLQQARKVLDLGCGTGNNCLELRELYPQLEMYGVDLMEKSAAPDFLAYTQLDLDRCALPYPDNFFDAILLTHVIEHLRFPLSLGDEINRVLKPGGKIYVEAPNWTTMFVPSFGYKRKQHSPFNFFDDPTHLKPWSKHGLFEFLYSSCRLQVEKVGAVRSWLRLPLDPLIIVWGLISGKRGFVISSFWNLYGWSIFAIGVKA